MSKSFYKNLNTKFDLLNNNLSSLYRKSKRKLLGYPISLWKKLTHSIYIKNDLNPPKKILSVPESHVYFGYYDLSPFNKSETKILCIQVKSPLTTPDKNAIANVGYFDLETNQSHFTIVGKTSTWNWQQGCRLRWFPDSSDETIFYNVLIGNHYGAIAQDIFSGQIQREINYPIYDLSPSGKWGISLNFSRLQRLRPGYGYVNVPDNTELDLCPDEDGIWLIDINRNQRKLLFSINEIADISPHRSMENAQHYINHLSINPSGTSFLFFHLWLDQNNKRHVRLFTADPEGRRLTLLNNTGHVSHYSWLSNERLVVTTFVAPCKLRYVLYHHIEGFERIIGIDYLTKDGHPTFMQNGKYLLTDTYPDDFQDQQLLLFNLEKNNLLVIDRFYSPPKFSGEMRCDLHPRPSPSGKLICIDNAVGNNRVIQIIDLSKFWSDQQE